jgi:hypothetical protein
MELKIRLSCFMLFVSFACSSAALARTTITYSGTYITVDGVQEVVDQYDSVCENFGPAMAEAYALGNLTGYPIGRASLGGLGHFCIGVAGGAGLTNTIYYNDEADVPDNVFPGIGPNPVLFLGLGITEKLDLMGKVFLFSTGFYKPPVDYDYLVLEKLNMGSFGIKARYRAVDPQTILPGIFSFGGISLGIGTNMMFGSMKFSGQYDYPLASVDVDPDGAGPLTASQYDVNFGSNYESEISWYILSANIEALVYIDLYWIFTLYSGFGLSGNYGSFSMKLSAQGNVTGDAPLPDPISTVTITSTNTYNPHYVIPLYILGLEVDLFALKFTVESMVSLLNGSDINIQFGTRFQF